MATRVWELLQAFSGDVSHRDCRCCGDGIAAADRFGTSEGVCRACRLDADR